MASTLFDSLFGVNRPALDAYVTQGQAQAGLRSAQTEEALVKAQQAREQEQAANNFKAAYQGMGHSQSETDLADSVVRGGIGKDFDSYTQGANNLLRHGLLEKVADPTVDPDTRRSALQALDPQAAPFTNVEGQLVDKVVRSGQNGEPTVFQTPDSLARQAAQHAVGDLHEAQARAGGFNPHANGGQQIPPDAQAAIANLIHENPKLAGNLRSLTSNGGWGVAYTLATGHPYPGHGPGGIPIDGQGNPTSPAPAPPPAAAGPAPAGAGGGDGPAPAPGGAGTAPAPLATGIAPAPGVSLDEQAHIRNDFASGVAARQTTSLNTMVQHSQLFDSIADQLHNGSFTPTNYIAQKWQQLFGSPVPTDLRVAGDFLGREAVRATVNSGAGTGAERELQVNASSSPEQLHDAARTMRALAGGQLQSLELRARRAGVDITQLLGPEAQAAFGLHHAGPRAPGALNTPSGQGPGAGGAAMSLDQYLKSKGF